MNTKEKREWLRENGHHVPRANAAVDEAYNEHTGDGESEPVLSMVAKSPNIYTYVGFGEDPPHMINFNGMQVFTRGLPVEVTDPRVLAELKDHKCFVKGEADMEAVYAQEKEEKKRVSKIRQRDIEMQIMAERANRG